ncbi:MAG: CooT family nickel-binding protein [Candidatus Nezhaarchaeales archaeon]
MCELKAVLNGKMVFKDVVYAKDLGGKVLLRSVLGEEVEVGEAAIYEVDIGNELLKLRQVTR